MLVMSLARWDLIEIQFHWISQVQSSRLNHASGNSSVTSHRIVAPRPELTFHQTAGGTITGPLQYGGTNPELFVFERFQVDFRNYDVSPQKFGADFVDPQNTGHRRQMFGLYQGYRPRGIRGPAEEIPHQSLFVDFGPLDNFDRPPAKGSQPNPFNTANLGNYLGKFHCLDSRLPHSR
jgi:hypothetical protein